MSAVGPNLRNTVFVGNIPYDMTEEQLKDIFAQIGPVMNFRYLYDKESGKMRGCAICEYRDTELTVTAVRSLNGYEVKGKLLRVDGATSERSREELKNLQLPSGGLLENTRDGEIEPEKAPEAISKAVASLPPEQMFELMKQMKMCIQNNPNEARNLLLQNPQLAYALLQAQVVMRIVDPQVALNILNRPHPNPVSSTSVPVSESETMKTTAPSSVVGTKTLTMTTSVLPGPPSSSSVDSLVSNVPSSAMQSIVTSAPALASLPLTNVSISDGARISAPPLRPPQLGDIHGPPMAPEVSRPSVPPSRHLPHPQRGADSFGPFGDPRTLVDRDMRIPPRSDINDVRLPPRIDQDMRQPPSLSLGDLDMRQPMGDQDFRMLRGPQMMDNRPYDPRLRSMASGESLGRSAPTAAPYDPRGPHPFDPRTAHEARQSASQPARLEDPRTLAAMRSQNSRPGPTATTSASSVLASLPNVGSSRPPSSSIIAAANAIAPNDQEKAALIMQVLQLSDDQIAMLPPGQRQSILILKEQIARSCPP